MASFEQLMPVMKELVNLTLEVAETERKEIIDVFDNREMLKLDQPSG